MHLFANFNTAFIIRSISYMILVLAFGSAVRLALGPSQLILLMCMDFLPLIQPRASISWLQSAVLVKESLLTVRR